MDIKPEKKPADCNVCAHFYITHDANFKYGCRALDFKSQRLPAHIVVEASGQACQFFRKKEQRQK